MFGIVANHAGKGSDSDYSYTYKSKRKSDAPVDAVPVDANSAQGDESAAPRAGRHASRPTVPVVDTRQSGDGRDSAEHG